MMDGVRPLALVVLVAFAASLLPVPGLAQQPGSAAPPPALPSVVAPAPPPVPPVVTTPPAAPPSPVAVMTPPPPAVAPLPRPQPTTGQEVGAAVVNVFRVPGKLLLCTLGAIGAGGLLVLTFGTGHRVAGDVFEEGCGGPWLLAPADLARDVEPARAFDPRNR